MTNSAAETDGTLLFEWASPKGEKFLISIFLVGSLLLHALAFYLFRIIYPSAIAVLPPPARVNFIAPNSEEGRTLLRWIEAEDPALASATVRPADTRGRALPKVAHVPSYVVQEPHLKQAPPIDLVPDTPSDFPAGPAPIARKPAEAAWPKLPTRISFSDELKGFGEIKLTPPQFTGSTGEPPENVEFRIGVNNHGEVRYCFRLNSSGDSALDEQARQWLVRTRFQPQTSSPAADERTLGWGVATIEWGNDVTQPPRNSAPVSR